MLRQVVLAVDGSEESRKAADLAEAIVRRFARAVVVVHVKALVYSGAAAWAPEWAPELEAFMADFVRRLTADGRQANSEILTRGPRAS
jgi:nucleotide-binding universal stress UspA family protein